MAIKKIKTGWQLDVQPGGRGNSRHRKTFDTKAEALVYEAWLKTQKIENPEWQPEKRDLRKLSDLVQIWFDHHGMGLRAGKNTFSRLKHMCTAMKDPVADRFSAEMFATYRRVRLDAGISQNNLNREHAYLRSVFNELIRLGYWKKENPLAKIRQFKIQERELTYLTHTQIQTLLTEIKQGRNPDAELITKICLSTGLAGAKQRKFERRKYNRNYCNLR
jgi:integrase